MTERPTPIAAILRGKQPTVEFSEDLLTSIAFGSLAWLPPSLGILPFLSRASPRLRDLRDIEAVDVEVWPWWDEHEEIAGAEPDVVLTLHDHHGRRRLIVVECKRRSGKCAEPTSTTLCSTFAAAATQASWCSPRTALRLRGTRSQTLAAPVRPGPSSSTTCTIGPLWGSGLSSGARLIGSSKVGVATQRRRARATRLPRPSYTR